MNSNRLWVIGSVTVMVIVLIGGWFLGIQPNLAAAAVNDTARADVEALNEAKQMQIATLTRENDDLESIQEQYVELQKSIPSSTDPAAFIAGLDALAVSTGVQVAGITVGASQAYTVPASAAAVEADPAADPDAAASESEVPTGSVAATSPLITPDNFVGISVGIDLKGPYQSVLSYLKGLQSGSRLVLVTGFTSNSDPESGAVTAHIDGMIYVLKQAG